MNPKLDPLVKKYIETKDQSLKEEIVKNYKPLIEYIARKLAFHRDDLDDLVQVGSIAVLKALDRFQIEKNTEFSTFATPNIIGEIKHYFRDKSRVVKIPRKLQELNSKIKTEIKLLQSTGIRITTALLSERLEVTEEILLEAMEAESSTRVVSLDNTNNMNDFFKTPSNSGTKMIDTIESKPQEDNFLIKETLKQALLKLEPRDRRVCYLRFYGGLSQADIAKRLDLSQMHISRILSKAVKLLRQKIKL